MLRSIAQYPEDIEMKFYVSNDGYQFERYFYSIDFDLFSCTVYFYTVD